MASSNCPSRTYAAPRFEQRIAAIGGDGQRRLVGVDGTEDVAGLMELDRARQELLGVGVRLRLRQARGSYQEREQ